MSDIKKEKRWVVWSLEEVNGRQTKVPYSITGKRASSTDEATWTIYEKAKAASEFFSGIGVVFTPAQTLLGIDIDHVLSPKGVLEHADKGAIAKLIQDARTYTEISPSGTGLHLYLALSGPLALDANRHAPFEAYTDGRYFTFTENSYHKKAKPIRTVTKEEALRLLAIIGYPWGKDTALAEGVIIGTETNFPDDELIDRLLSSKNGDKVDRLYSGDISDYDGDASRADMALLAHLAFWSGRNAAQMERLWLASPLAKREKTQKRQDYRTRSIASAIQNCKDVYTSPTLGIDFLFTTTAQGNKSYNKNTENVCRILRHHSSFKSRLRFDDFKNRIELDDKPFVDSDTIDLQTSVSILFPFMRTVGKDMVYDAIVKVAKENRIDSARDFIRSIPWDRTPRINTWLEKTYGVPDDEYHRAVASNWLKGLVKRIIEPGSKFDYVLVLEGPQGARKSTSLNILGRISPRDNWHVESTMSTDTKDFFMQFEGKAIIEFSEGETLSRTEVKKMKSIITTASDRYRPSYGRVAEDFPRRCVFAMTTNQEQYLKDETGNRRWLPVRLVFPQADIDWLRENRDQLLAEAYERAIVKQETTYEFPEEETLKQQDSRRVSDPNSDKIVEWYYSQFNTNDKKEGITVEAVYHGALGGFGSMKGWEAAAIADVLKRDLGLIRKRRMINGVQQWRWVNENKIPVEELDLAEGVFE